MNRRDVVVGAALAGPAALASRARGAAAAAAAPKIRYKLSLAAYSLRKRLDLKSPTMTLFQFVEQCADWGVEGTELTEYYFPKPITPEYVMRLKRAVLKAGLDVTGTPIGNTFTLPPGEARAQEIEKMKKWIDVSADLGSPAIRTFAGNVPKGTDEAQARKWVVECLQACLEHAARRGVVLALENHGGVVATADGLLEIVRAVKSEWVAVNLDTGNFRSSDPYAELERCAPLAVTCQVKVHVTRAGKKEKEPMDYARIARMMRAVGYRGYLTLEYEADEDPMAAIPRHLAELRKVAG